MIPAVDFEPLFKRIVKLLVTPLAQMVRVGMAFAVVIAIGSAAHEHASGNQNFVHLAEQGFRIGQMFDGLEAHGGIELTAESGQVPYIAGKEFDPGVRELRVGAFNRLGRDIDAGYGGCALFGKKPASVSNPAGCIQYTEAAASGRKEFISLPVLGLEDFPFGGSRHEPLRYHLVDSLCFSK